MDIPEAKTPPANGSAESSTTNSPTGGAKAETSGQGTAGTNGLPEGKATPAETEVPPRSGAPLRIPSDGFTTRDNHVSYPAGENSVADREKIIKAARVEVPDQGHHSRSPRRLSELIDEAWPISKHAITTLVIMFWLGLVSLLAMGIKRLIGDGVEEFCHTVEVADRWVMIMAIIIFSSCTLITLSQLLGKTIWESWPGYMLKYLWGKVWVRTRSGREIRARYMESREPVEQKTLAWVLMLDDADKQVNCRNQIVAKGREEK